MSEICHDGAWPFIFKRFCQALLINATPGSSDNIGHDLGLIGPDQPEPGEAGATHQGAAGSGIQLDFSTGDTHRVFVALHNSTPLGEYCSSLMPCQLGQR